jgi:hypothetical protein
VGIEFARALYRNPTTVRHFSGFAAEFKVVRGRMANHKSKLVLETVAQFIHLKTIFEGADCNVEIYLFYWNSQKSHLK